MEVEVLTIGNFTPALLGIGLSFGLTASYTAEDIDNNPDYIKDRLYHIAHRLAFKNNGENKFLRLLPVTLDITAPLYWWKQMDQYKVATTTLSESTMHTITRRPFDLSMFETHNLDENGIKQLQEIIEILNNVRKHYLETTNDAGLRKSIWYTLISVLPSAFLQRRIFCCSYATLQNIIEQRRDHKLEEWKYFIRKVLESSIHAEYLDRCAPIEME